MVDIPKNLLNRVKQGESIQIIEDHIINNYPIPMIIKAFAELIVTSDDYVNKPQIIVTQEELDLINSIFRVKGHRVVDGEVIVERRGRPRKGYPNL
jgi:hypothetical protein